MRQDCIPISVIVIPENRRTLSEDGVVRLMESIGRIGLQTPPTVRVSLVAGEELPVIVAGAHRLEACRRLGWSEIPVMVMEGDEADARLWEIAENLHRADLSPVERAEHIEEWRRLTAERVSNSDTLNRQPHEAGVSKVARDLGVSRASVVNAAKIASLPQETRDQAREERWPATRLLQAAKPQKSTVQPAPEPRNDIEVTEAQVTALMRAWNAAGQEAREEFLRRVDGPIFDRTAASA